MDLGGKYRCKQARKEATQEWEERIEGDMEVARRTGDFRQMWYLGRLLGGTGERARKRNTRDVRRNDPTVAEWSEAMQAPGPEGDVRRRKYGRDVRARRRMTEKQSLDFVEGKRMTRSSFYAIRKS